MCTSLVELLVVLAVVGGLLAGALGLGASTRGAAERGGARAVGIVSKLSAELSN